MVGENLRSYYRYWAEIGTRWADCDSYGHVNNAQYYSYFDTALTSMLIETGAMRSAARQPIGLCVESQCSFHAPIGFPATIDAGVAISHCGTKSVRYEVGLFPIGEDAPAASGYFVHVFVDPETRRPMALTDQQRLALASVIVADV